MPYQQFIQSGVHTYIPMAMPNTAFSQNFPKKKLRKTAKESSSLQMLITLHQLHSPFHCFVSSELVRHISPHLPSAAQQQKCHEIVGAENSARKAQNGVVISQKIAIVCREAA